jgi:hypothetical protein
VLNVELIPNLIPVELISFTAEVFNNDVNLSWQTATEKNNSGFEVERAMSEDQIQSWEAIGFVQGSGTTAEFHYYSFTNKNVKPGFYQYRLKQIDFEGSFTYSNIVEVEVEAPNVFTLEQNYPNPFNPSTVINYQLPVNSMVTLKIYDILGNEIVTLVNEEKPAGSYEVEYDGTELPSGIYLYKLQTSNFIDTKKMILIK